HHIVRLSQLAKNTPAIVLSVQQHDDVDPIAKRLNELGFVSGETIRLITRAPFGGDPILVQVGFTRFALRVSEAERVLVKEVRP
nr:FeoA family protein [Agitococcus sp.]